MADCVHCIPPILTCLEAFIVGNGTHRRNERAINNDSALLTCTVHVGICIFVKFHSCADKSSIFVNFGLAADLIIYILQLDEYISLISNFYRKIILRLSYDIFTTVIHTPHYRQYDMLRDTEIVRFCFAFRYNKYRTTERLYQSWDNITVFINSWSSTNHFAWEVVVSQMNFKTIVTEYIKLSIIYNETTFKFLSIHLLLWMNVTLDFIRTGFARQWGTGRKRKIQDEIMRHANRGHLLLRTPGPVPFWDLHLFYVLRPATSYTDKTYQFVTLQDLTFN